MRHSVAALCIGLTTSLAAVRAPAQPTADRGASILVFPRVIADGSADTIVQLANLSDNTVYARCAYAEGGSGGWQAAAFSLQLDPQRPLFWTAARGRMASSGEASLDIPAAPAEFRGELLCVQVDGAGAPFSGNELAGQVTLAELASGDVSAYGAVGLRGSGFNDGDDVLCIGGEPSGDCLIGAEYDACPAEWILGLPAEGAADIQLAPGLRISTRLTVVPCSQNLRDGPPTTVDLDVMVYNELAERFTGTASVTSWADLALADIGGQIFTRGVLGTAYAEARLRPAAGSGGFVLVAQTTRATGDALVIAGAASTAGQHRGSADLSDLIVLP